MIFFGTQPTLTQVPPRRPDSTSAVRAPYSAARCAAASPPLPPPITTRSNRSSMAAMLYERLAAPLQWRLQGHVDDLSPWTIRCLVRTRCRRSRRYGPSTSSRRCGSCWRATGRASGRWRRSPSRRSPRSSSRSRSCSTGCRAPGRPVSHLNAVLNSDALRNGYNACLPLLVRLPDRPRAERAAVSGVQRHRRTGRRTLEPVQRRVIEHALRDFRLAGVGLPAERKERFKTVMLELTQLQAKFEENVLDATNGWTCQRHRCGRAARPE